MKTFSKLNLKNTSGQLAVGLAIGFACILAMLGLVFQSTLYTRDKIKMQTTADYAVLIAANNQADNLNKIRELNQAINTAFRGAQALVQPSYALIWQVATYYGVAEGAAALAASSATMGEVSGGDCSSLGQKVDQYYRKKIITAYNLARNQAASSIISAIKDSNKLSFNQALNIFLAPENLPSGLYLELQKQLGKGYKLASVKTEYDAGNLSNSDDFSYDVLSENKDDPLFIPKNEPRMFTYDKWTYYTGPCPESVTTYSPCCFGPVVGMPGVTLSNARVVRATDDTTYFLSGTRYIPPLSIIQKMLKIGVKNPDKKDDKFGQDIKVGINNDTLFRKIDKNKRTMFQVLSAAKPYGGTYPKAGFIADSTGISGTAGDKFTGSKLFGIADTTETQGIRVFRADGSIDKKDYQGNVTDSVPYYAEDFLH